MSAEREYRDWIARGNFDSLRRRSTEDVAAAIDARRPDLVAFALDRLAWAYHCRGAVRLVDRESAGWHDVQAGYLANVYAFRFRIPLMTASAARRDDPNYLVQSTISLGFARLFGVAFDENLIREWLAPRFDLTKLTGSVVAGGVLLAALFDSAEAPSFADLRTDRKACRKARDAWPKRPTEIAPLDMLDVEIALCHPELANFPYVQVAYAPTEDDAVIGGLTAFHEWYD